MVELGDCSAKLSFDVVTDPVGVKSCWVFTQDLFHGPKDLALLGFANVCRQRD